MTDAAGDSSPVPFVVRVAHGNIVDANAGLVAVSHVNDVAPTGAERAIDELLGGAISRRAASLRGRMGTTHFLPTLASPIATGCVLVVSLGDSEHFNRRRLGEVGVAMVEAAATAGARDVATVVHGAGSAGVEPRDAARRLVSGVLDALRRVPGGEILRELTLVELHAERVDEVVAGVREASAPSQVHVYVQAMEVRRRMQPVGADQHGTPSHLRLGITRAGPDLKVTRIGDEAFDRAVICPYPERVAGSLSGRLARGVLDEPSAPKRSRVSRSLGKQLYTSFLGVAELGAGDLIRNAPEGLVVLRLDGWTVDLPWELLHTGGDFVALECRMARQLEINSTGRQSASVVAHDRLRVLVIGNPTGDLPGAEREAKAVADLLEARADADVRIMLGRSTYGEVSDALDGESYDVLHYAGHASFVEGRPDASGLALADQLLTPEDLATRAYLPRLVIVNACHSAATGKPFAGNQETRTLVAGLLSAGVRAFIGAMWKVDDEAAATFATTFYDAIAPGGEGPQPVGEAVRLGRLAIVETHGRHELSWAAYALYGSPWRQALDPTA